MLFICWVVRTRARERATQTVDSIRQSLVLAPPCGRVHSTFPFLFQHVFYFANLFWLLSFILTADTESTEPGAIQDILTCGLCQKTFALADIVKFIQHKVLQCNKENYEQCFTQGTSPIPPLMPLFIFPMPMRVSSHTFDFVISDETESFFYFARGTFRWLDGQRLRGQSAVDIGQSATIDIGVDFNAKTFVIPRAHATARESRIREWRRHFQHTKKTINRR